MTYCVWIILTYIPSCAISKILWIIGLIFTVDCGCSLHSTLVGDEVELLNSELRNLASRNEKHPSIVRCKVCLENYLGMDHECDEQTDDSCIISSGHVYCIHWWTGMLIWQMTMKWKATSLEDRMTSIEVFSTANKKMILMPHHRDSDMLLYHLLTEHGSNNLTVDLLVFI